MRQQVEVTLMVWYYVKDGARQGPVEEAELTRLVGDNVVRADTLVWSEGMSDWKPYSTVNPGGSALYSHPGPVTSVVAEPEPRFEEPHAIVQAPVVETRVEPQVETYRQPTPDPIPDPVQATFQAPVQALPQPMQQPGYTPVAALTPVEQIPIGPNTAEPMLYCSQCGRQYGSAELVRFGTAMVCANCKDFYAQRLRETGQVVGARVYGGFWIRFLAVVIDGILLGIVNFALQTVMSTRITNPADVSNIALLMSSIGINFTISIVLNMLYEAFFLVQYGATPGKMIFKLKVITPDGGGLSWGRAIGRYFAKILSSITLLIGYIMAGFDSEKRALHDYIAGTRVIRTA